MTVRTKVSTLAVLMATAAIGSAAVAVPAQAAPTILEPNPCAGRNDGGTGGSYDIPNSSGMVMVYGTWYNCSGGAGADWVQLQINNGFDPPCISVPYGSTGSSSQANRDWGPDVTYGGWKRC